MQLDALHDRAQAFMQDLLRESYLAYAGRQAHANTEAIYRQYADLLTPDVLQGCLARFKDAPVDSEAFRAARLMLEWQIEVQVGRGLAQIEDREVAVENAAVVTLDDGRTVPYAQAPIEIMNTVDRHARNAIDAARATVAAAEIAPLRLERLQREHDAVHALQIVSSPTDPYTPTFETLTGISISALATSCAQFLRDTQAMWDDTLRAFLKPAGIPPAEATRADVLALFRLPEYDDAFPGSAMQEAVRRSCTECGIDPDASGRIIYDLDDRPGKRARAFCAAVRVPDEVYLVLRPHGGQTDYRTLLHELGHALHFAYVDPSLPFEYRWIGDNSVTEAYAMLFDHRMQDRGWLLRYTTLGRDRVDAFLRYVAFEELHMLRRYCAKLLYEVQVHSGTVPWDQLPALYVETLSSATGFRYRAEDALLDLDPRYYVIRYLRAWQLQAVLNHTLVERFDLDWWRNPSAGPWLVRELFSHGQRERADEIPARIGGDVLSFTPLIQHVERLLA